MATSNSDALFRGVKDPLNYNRKIHIQEADSEHQKLLAARNLVRAELRAAFGNFRTQFSDEVLFEGVSQQARSAARDLTSLPVRFLMQGSAAYRTLVRPAQKAHQAMDVDDGVYLPVPFVNGEPVFSPGALFQVAEKALVPLARRQGWGLEPKDTCIRISLSGTIGGYRAHIDLPLLAVESTEFYQLNSVLEQNLGGSPVRFADLAYDPTGSIKDQRRIVASGIKLAHRTDGWVDSDPKKFEDWFEKQVHLYGDQLRRMCRYFKGWRDHVWSDSNLSSIGIMIGCREALSKYQIQSDDRDDLAALDVALHLRNLCSLEGGLVHPITGQPLDMKWSSAERADIISNLELAISRMEAAINETNAAESVVHCWKAVFGDRFPYCPDSIVLPSGLLAAQIRRTPAEVQPLSKVGTSTSG